jgi:hypothetical protein
MNLRVLASLLVALPSVVLGAETWTSPDGFLSVARPDADRFQAVPESPPPFLALWISNDESVKLGVAKTEVPARVRLVQSSVERGFAKEVGGQVTRLPTRIVSGYDVWQMKASSPSGEITQTIIRRDGAVYKLMAMTTGEDAQIAQASRFLDSLSVAQSAAAQPGRTAAKPGKAIDTHTLSKSLGGAGILLAVGLAIYLFARGRKARKAADQGQ